jgi:hypothetical protein
MASYREQIAQMRADVALRQEADLELQAQTLHNEMMEAEKYASDALSQNDRQSAEYYAQEMNQKEAELRNVLAYLPQPGPQVDPRLVEFVQKNESFFNKYGNAGVQGFELAHQYATRPRNPTSNNPATTGMGLQFGTPEYFSAVKDLMQMYGKDYGLNFDPGDELMTPDEAAKISGISPREYNNGVRRMLNEGKDSATEYGAQWNREVG